MMRFPIILILLDSFSLRIFFIDNFHWGFDIRVWIFYFHSSLLWNDEGIKGLEALSKGKHEPEMNSLWILQNFEFFLPVVFHRSESCGGKKNCFQLCKLWMWTATGFDKRFSSLLRVHNVFFCLLSFWCFTLEWTLLAFMTRSILFRSPSVAAVSCNLAVFPCGSPSHRFLSLSIHWVTIWANSRFTRHVKIFVRRRSAFEWKFD